MDDCNRLPASQRWAVATLMALGLAGSVHSEPANIVRISGARTSITSTAVRMISYRNQYHSWQTSDGAIHLMVNQGSVATGDSLMLYSSFDAGVTWIPMFTLPQSDAESTSDGILDNSASNGPLLQLVYATSATTGQINYTSATYNSATQSWTLSAVQTAFANTQYAGTIPTITTDAAGNLWCAFTQEQLKTKQYEIRMLYQLVNTQTWTDTGNAFDTPNTSAEQSGRAVPLASGVGLIFQEQQTLYWAYRLTPWDDDAPWTTSVLAVGLAPASQDPDGTHFSVVSDLLGNLHLAYVANRQLFYLRYDSPSSTWGIAQPLTGSDNETYPEATISGANLVLMVNNSNLVQVFQSTDSGTTFIQTQSLVHQPPAPGSQVNYTDSRVEAPAIALCPIPTWQQYVNGPLQKLLFFQVPVIN